MHYTSDMLLLIIVIEVVKAFFFLILFLRIWNTEYEVQ